MVKILLVEDDKSLREIYGVRLRAEGYDIISAGDGEQALAIAVKERPDLIISDVMMPKISGFDMLDIIRSTPETRDMKVIMMTALSSEDQRSRGETLGANRYLIKSQVGIEDVFRTVHDVLADSPVTSAPTSNIFSTPMTAATSQQQPTVSSPTPVETPAPATSIPAPVVTTIAPEPTILAAAQPVVAPVQNPIATPIIPSPVVNNTSAVTQFDRPQVAPTPYSPPELDPQDGRVISPVVNNQPNITSLMDQELNSEAQNTAPTETITPDQSANQ